LHMLGYASMCQRMLAYVRICKHMPAYASICLHVPAQDMVAYANIFRIKYAGPVLGGRQAIGRLETQLVREITIRGSLR